MEATMYVPIGDTIVTAYSKVLNSPLSKLQAYCNSVGDTF